MRFFWGIIYSMVNKLNFCCSQPPLSHTHMSRKFTTHLLSYYEKRYSFVVGRPQGDPSHLHTNNSLKNVQHNFSPKMKKVWADFSSVMPEPDHHHLREERLFCSLVVPDMCSRFFNHPFFSCLFFYRWLAQSSQLQMNAAVAESQILARMN